VNYLYRGGEPKINGSFAYTNLTAQMKSLAKTEGNTTLPDNFFLVDINLIDFENKDELADILLENQWFTQNPSKGFMIQHRILGEQIDPFTMPSDLVKSAAMTFNQWSQDKLPDFLDTIHNLVTATKTSLPLAVYVHCECGCDRTGEVSGSYYMQYMKMNLHDAHELDKKIAGREIDENCQYAMYWHCFYLKYAKNFTITCEK